MTGHQQADAGPYMDFDHLLMDRVIDPIICSKFLLYDDFKEIT